MKIRISIVTLVIVFLNFSNLAVSENLSKKEGSISGRLVPKATKASVMIFRESQILTRASIDEKSGRYILTDIPEGTYRLHFILTKGDETIFLEGMQTSIKRNTLKESDRQAIVKVLRELAIRINAKDYQGILALYSKKYKDEYGMSWTLQDNWYRGLTSFTAPFHLEGYISDVIGENAKAAVSVHYIFFYKFSDKDKETSDSDRVIFLTKESGKWLIEGEKRSTTSFVHKFLKNAVSRVFLKTHLTKVNVRGGKETVGCDLNLDEIYPGIKLLE